MLIYMINYNLLKKTKNIQIRDFLKALLKSMSNKTKFETQTHKNNLKEQI